MPRLQVNGVTIAYTDTGSPLGKADAPIVVFGHGLMMSGWMFHEQIAVLRQRYRCITLDWRGQGDTPATSSGYDMDTLTEDVVGLIEQLRLTTVHYVGLSMGGFVGIRLAARRGDLLRSLTLLDTSADAQDATTARRLELLALIYRLVGFRPVRKRLIPSLFGPSFLASAESRPRIKEWARRQRNCDRAGMSKAIIGVAHRPAVLAELGRSSAQCEVVVQPEVRGWRSRTPARSGSGSGSGSGSAAHR
ncbi:alpha/beta fold hydrolase [Streptomyces sp. NBC_01455]|uniref:alpha/beta fold hydrolase n=1 Tax=Streptomyces sp. NBC_01455 TaxID=2903874 RepID=UPI002E33573A|nr:alpha/beta fold hydrolase [Streptomyces sp. NBC_01455]